MPSFDDDEVSESRHGNGYYVDTDDAIQALIENFDGQGRQSITEALRAVKRAHRVLTSDLVGNDNMVGARVTYVDGDGDPHRALVIEPEVASIPHSEVYDPRRDEMVDPADYPTGTVQLIYGDGGDFGTEGYFFDRMSKLDHDTSVPPAKSVDDTRCYFAGWEAYDDMVDD